MSVLEAVTAKARALSSGSEEADKDKASSRVSARERLRRLGIGNGTLTRFPAQSLPESLSSANSPLESLDDGVDIPDSSTTSFDRLDSTASIKKKSRNAKSKGTGNGIKDKTGRWKSDLKAMYTDEHVRELSRAGLTENIDRVVDTPQVADVPVVNQQLALAIKRRRIAAKQLKQFHVFSLSLVAVLVCSVWMFGYAMLA